MPFLHYWILELGLTGDAEDPVTTKHKAKWMRTHWRNAAAKAKAFEAGEIDARPKHGSSYYLKKAAEAEATFAESQKSALTFQFNVRYLIFSQR